MSATEWKTGDVALRVSPHSAGNYVALRVNGCTGIPMGHLPHWHFVVEGIAATQCGEDGGLAEYRRLVVLDPESAEDVERLCAAYMTNPNMVVSPEMLRARMERMLDELANPTPPKPEEPTGLGAVVEDGDGGKWVRTPSGAWHGPGKNFAAKWDYLPDGAIVRVLSEGVVPE